jgi:uncharacterized tellurite resistance protein B-like protein
VEQLKKPGKNAVAQVRFESERREFEEIRRDPGIQQRAAELGKRDETEAHRRRLLASGLRITDRIIPSLVENVRWAQDVTGLRERGVEIYVCDDARQNAMCIDTGEGQISLLLTSSLIEKMAEEELLFVIGHELGHVSYGHHALPVRAMLTKSGGSIPGNQAMRLMSWSRRAELSADRVGLLCCQDVHAATTSLIKLSCGLTESLAQFNVEDYVSQMRDIQALSDSVHDARDWFSSHPFNPLRVTALHYFWESTLLTELLDRSPALMPVEKVDEKINELLEFMEPETAEANQDAATDCLLWGSYWVAASDGDTDALESTSIRNMVDEQAVQQAEAEIARASDPSVLIEEKFQQAAKGCMRMPPHERHALVQKLIVVAQADEHLAEEEKAVLRQVCEALKVNPLFVEQMLLMIG